MELQNKIEKKNSIIKNIYGNNYLLVLFIKIFIMFNICVVGMPFSGKTTIINLLCQMYDMIPFSMSLELKKINNDKKMSELGDCPKNILNTFIENNKLLCKGFAIDYLKTSTGMNDIEDIFNNNNLSFPIVLFVDDDNILNLFKKAINREISFYDKKDLTYIQKNINCLNIHNRIKKYLFLQNDIDTLLSPWNKIIYNGNNDETDIIKQIENIVGIPLNNLIIDVSKHLIDDNPSIKNITVELINNYFDERKYDYLEFVLSVTENKKILNWLNQKINIKKGEYLFFPGEMVYSMDNKSVERVIYNNYMVSLKLDGVRFLLCCNGDNMYFINRSFDIYKKTTKKIYKCHAIFDGELIKCKYGKYWYIIFDVLYYDNMILPTDVSQKLHIVNDIPFYNDEYIEDDITIVKKMYFNKNETPLLIKFKSIYPGDGLIFTPVDTSNPTFKWKKIHTFDFRLIKSNNTYKLYAFNGYKEVEFVNCIIYNDKLNLDKYVDKIVECYEHNNRSKNNKRIYEIKNIRTDKNRPNKIQMIVNTTKLSEYDLLKNFNNLKK